MYRTSQIELAKENAKLHGIQLPISDEQAIAFLDWYFANKAEYSNTIQVAAYCFSGLNSTGYKQRISKWEEILGLTDEHTKIHRES